MKIKTTLFITLLFGVICFTQCTNQKGYTIKATFPADLMSSSDTLFMYDVNMKVMNKTVFKDGMFTMKGFTPFEDKVILGNVKKDFYLTMFLENSDFTITSDESRSYIKGGKVQDLIYGFYEDEAYNKMLNEYYQLEEKQQNAANEKEAEALAHKAKELETKLFEYEYASFRNILEGDYPVRIKLLALTSTQDWVGYPEDKQLKMLDEYEKILGKNILIDNHRVYLATEVPEGGGDGGEQELSPVVGSKFIDISALDENANKVALSDVVKKNKYVLLEFWASWCQPCRKEIPNLKKAYKKYKAKGFEIYSVSLDKRKSDWINALKEEKAEWINLIAIGDFKSDAAKYYGVNAIPSSFLISKDGFIVAKGNTLRGYNLDEILKGIMN